RAIPRLGRDAGGAGDRVGGGDRGRAAPRAEAAARGDGAGGGGDGGRAMAGGADADREVLPRQPDGRARHVVGGGGQAVVAARRAVLHRRAGVRGVRAAPAADGTAARGT